MPFKNVVAAAFNSLLVVKGVFGFAIVVAIVGIFAGRRT